MERETCKVAEHLIPSTNSGVKFKLENYNYLPTSKITVIYYDEIWNKELMILQPQLMVIGGLTYRVARPRFFHFPLRQQTSVSVSK